MTERRTFVQAGALALLGVPSLADAQRSGTPRIGFLTPGPILREAAFWQGMRDLGYVDGKTIVVDRRSAEGDFARLPALAAEIVKNRPDVIVALVSAPAIAAKVATSTIPIVMVSDLRSTEYGQAGNMVAYGRLQSPRTTTCRTRDQQKRVQERVSVSAAHALAHYDQ